MSLKLFQFIVFVLFFFVLHYARTWDYNNPNAEWAQPYPKCCGKMQSPIGLSYSQSKQINGSLYYLNYNVQLKDSLTIQNNGHSVFLSLPNTIIGKRPQIYGGFLQGRFEAVSLHFHWGGPKLNGSEHCINGKQYDGELHIVHKNLKYNSLGAALGKSDGIAVLAFMLLKLRNVTTPVGLQKVLKRVSQIQTYNSYATIETFELGQILESQPSTEFYTYEGSFTTPHCHEGVTWQVFEKPINVEYSDIENLFNVQDAKGQTLQGNCRPLQPLNERAIYYVP